jgi:predicted ATPase
MRAAIDAVAASGARISQTFLLAHLAEAYLRYGRVAQAGEALDAAFDALEATGEAHTEAELHRLRGEFALVGHGDEIEAEREFRQAIAIARKQQARGWELRATTSLSRLVARASRPGISSGRAGCWPSSPELQL